MTDAKPSVYAVAERVPHGIRYITKGARYEVLSDDDGSFVSRDNNGHKLVALWANCPHLHGGNWARVAECESCGGMNLSCPEGCERDPETGELFATPEQPEQDRAVAAWQSIETAPDDRPFIAAIQVRTNGGAPRWEQHIIWRDDETGGVHRDCEQGWDLEDYACWQPTPADPQELGKDTNDAA